MSSIETNFSLDRNSDPVFSQPHPAHTRQTCGSETLAIISLPLPVGVALPAAGLFSPGLIVIAHFETGLVEQRWLPVAFDARELPELRSLGGSSTRALCKEPRDYNGALYYLPEPLLTAFTDSAGLPRLPGQNASMQCDCSTLSHLTRLVLPSLKVPELVAPTFIEHFVRVLCAHVVNLRNSPRVTTIHYKGGLSPFQKRRAAQMLTSELGSHAGLSFIAHHCGLSVSHFSRSFKVSFGMPVHRWIIEQKVNRAKYLLVTSHQALIDVAMQAGFNDQASFNRTFARLTGTSPGRWRRTHGEFLPVKGVRSGRREYVAAEA